MKIAVGFLKMWFWVCTGLIIFFIVAAIIVLIVSDVYTTQLFINQTIKKPFSYAVAFTFVSRVIGSYFVQGNRQENR